MRHEETLGGYRHVLILMVMTVSQVYNSTRLGFFFLRLYFFPVIFTRIVGLKLTTLRSGVACSTV